MKFWVERSSTNRHVEACASERASKRIDQFTGHTKVGQFDNAFTGKQYVGRFDVPVNRFL